jgi:hypothetical protein
MALKISASDLVTNRQLLVDDTGVEYRETAAFGGGKRFPFSQIDCVLLSPKGVLSIQVGSEVYGIPTKTDNTKHKELIDTLVKALKATL